MKRWFVTVTSVTYLHHYWYEQFWCEIFANDYFTFSCLSFITSLACGLNSACHQSWRKHFKSQMKKSWRLQSIIKISVKLFSSPASFISISLPKQEKNRARLRLSDHLDCWVTKVWLQLPLYGWGRPLTLLTVWLTHPWEVVSGSWQTAVS